MAILNQDNPKVRILQLEELEILKTVRDFCDQKGIQYYLAFGTLLGAVRHQGFIPWDDDIDIFMKREDYNRFIIEAENGLPEWLTIRSFNNTELRKERFTFQIKVEAKNKYVIRKVGGNYKKHRIWIDIFPLDGMPRNSMIRNAHFRLIELHDKFCDYAQILNNYDLNKQRSFLRRLRIEIIDSCRLWKLIPPRKVFSAFDNCMSRYRFDRSDFVLGYARVYGKKSIVERSCFGDGKKMQFEGEDYSIPEKPEKLLRSWYGDYNTLPPEEKRVAKHCVDIILE